MLNYLLDRRALPQDKVPLGTSALKLSSFSSKICCLSSGQYGSKSVKSNATILTYAIYDERKNIFFDCIYI